MEWLTTACDVVINEMVTSVTATMVGAWVIDTIMMTGGVTYSSISTLINI